MTVGYMPGGVPGGVPAHSLAPAAAAAAAASSGSAVSPDAEAPVWQPWADVQKDALGQLKTAIDRRLAVYRQEMQAATQVYDVAQSTAASQTRHLEATAQEMYNRYMDEARRINDMIMDPAIAAYNESVAAAHTRLWKDLTPVERMYAKVAADATWTDGLTHGGAKVS